MHARTIRGRLLQMGVLLSILGVAFSHANALADDHSAQDGDMTVWTWRVLTTDDGTKLPYAVVEPIGVAVDAPVPTLLALPPGTQTQQMAEFGLKRFWGRIAAERGWRVIAPSKPGTASFYEGAESYLPELMDAVAAEWSIEGSKFHLAGVSNGGRSAFRVATLFPDRFHSLTVLPGFPPTRTDNERLDALMRMPVTMYVGGRDRLWLDQAKRTDARLKELGHPSSTLIIFDQDSHPIESLTSSMLMDRLHELRQPSASPREAINTLLDTFHRAASSADGKTYFGCMTIDGVFIGTDPGERWTREEFVRMYQPYLDRGTGWTYVPRDRTVTMLLGGEAAMFDELLDNEKYGVCRGVGLVVRGPDGAWRIAQYALSMTIPNAVAGDVVDLIRNAEVDENNDEDDEDANSDDRENR